MNDSLWVDELHTSWCIADGFGDVYHRANQGNQSPVYYWLQWLIKAIFGHSEIAIRALSWFSATVLATLIMLIAHRESRSAIAAIAIGLLFAIDSNLIFYANEARPYALLQLTATLSAYSCYRYAMTGELFNRVIWISCTVASCYLHYTAGLLLFGELAFLISASRLSRFFTSVSVRTTLFDFAIIAACLMPTLPHLIAIGNRRTNWEHFVGRRDLSDIYSVLPSAYLVVVAAVTLAVIALILVVATRIGIAHVAGDVTDAEQPRRRLTWLLLCVCWFFVPTAIAFALNNTDLARVFFRRYMVSVIPATYLFIGALVAFPRTRRMQLLMAAIVVCIGFYESYTVRPFSPFVFVSQHSREDWRTAVDVLKNETSPGEPTLLLLRAGLIEDDFLRTEPDKWSAYSKLPLSGIYRLDREQFEIISLAYTDSGDLSPAAISTVMSRTQVFLLLRGRNATREAVASAVSDATENRFELAKQTTLGPALGLYEMRRR